jgi:hypothetical protein
VTTLFAEYTGSHQPLEVDWSLERGVRATATSHRTVPEQIVVDDALLVAPLDTRTDETLAQGEALGSNADQSLTRTGPSTPARPLGTVRQDSRPFTTFWEFAVALNRSDAAALALAGNGASDLPIDGADLRKLLGLMWFRTALGRLSQDWRDRILDVLIDSTTVQDHALKLGRQTVHLRDLTYEQLQEIGAKTIVSDSIQPDLDLLITVGRFWGPDALTRFRFTNAPERQGSSMVESLLQKFRN